MEIDLRLVIVATVVCWATTALPLLVLYLIAGRRHDRELARLHESYGVLLTTKANVEQYGRARPAQAVTEDATPAPEERAQYEATEAAVEHMAQQIHAAYEATGFHESWEHCVEEARQMFLGSTPPIPAELKGLVRD